MRTFTAHHIRYRASRVQVHAFQSGVIAAIAFVGLLIADNDALALAMAILGSVALGISIGAWTVASRFND